MNKRYVWSALMIAAIAVACDSNTDDPEPTVPVPTPTVPVPTPTDSVPSTPVPTDSVPTTPEPPATHGNARVIEITPSDTTVSADAHTFTVRLYADGEHGYNTQDLPGWIDLDFDAEDNFIITVAENSRGEERVASFSVSSAYAEATFTLTQQARDITSADDSITSSIGSMTGVDFVLGPIPMEVKGTLTYSVTCDARNYTQGTLTISKSDLCSTLGITTADFDARKGNTIVCLPMNKDWSEGENTANGSYGAWFGSSGTIGWGSSSIAYLEGSDMISFGYGMHPDNRSNSCVCRLQYQDKENETACNVEVTVSLKQ